jgi:hypothetical protein
MSADPGSFSQRKTHSLRDQQMCAGSQGFASPEGQCLGAAAPGLGLRGRPVGHGA